MKSEGGLIRKIKQSSWFDRIAKIKNIEIIIAIIICVIMIAVYFIVNAASKGDEKAADDNAVAVTDTETYSEAEVKLSEILSKIKNAGEVHVLITNKEQACVNDKVTVSSPAASEIVGVLVVAKGAGNVVVKLELIRAVQTATGISADKIEVFEMK